MGPEESHTSGGVFRFPGGEHGQYEALLRWFEPNGSVAKSPGLLSNQLALRPWKCNAFQPAFNVVFFLPPIEVNFSWKERWSGSNNLVGTMRTFAHSSARRGNDTALKREHLMSESARKVYPRPPF